MNSRGVQSCCEFSRAIWASLVAQMVKNLPAKKKKEKKKRICLQCRRPRFDPWVRKIPWRREWLPTPVSLPGEFHGQRSLADCSPWGRRESDKTEQLTLSLFFFFFLHSLETPDSYNPTGINSFSLMPLAKIPGLDSLVVAREENGSFISGLWLGWWEVPEVREQRTVEGIQLSVGPTAHWLPVDLSFPLCSQTPVTFWKGQCPDLQDWGSLALPSYGGHVLTSLSEFRSKVRTLALSCQALRV